VSADFIPSDQESRSRIENELGSTFFVEAGAGTGKTRELVQRIVNLIKEGRAEIGSIAAITFSEAAAAELKDRVRFELEKHSISPDLDDVQQAMCRAAVAGMDSAAIQTLHAFASSILREKPFEAGLPPNFQVLADIEESIDFEENWQSWIDASMENAEVSGSLFTAMALGLKLDGLKELANSLQGDYDRLPEHFAAAAVPQRRAVAALVAGLNHINSLIPLAVNGEGDPLVRHARRLLATGRKLALMEQSGDAALSLLGNFGKLDCSRGAQKDWLKNPVGGLNGCKELKEVCSGLEEIRKDELEQVRVAALMPLLESLRTFTLDCVQRRRSSGKALFQDLLIWARDMLRDNAAVRGYFQQRYTHLLIDEFQDTDPIQAEIAFFIAADAAAMGKAALTEKDWQKLLIAPGKLFVVGDPKQSIYRFRRADIATVHDVAALLGPCRLPLQQNFRSQEPVINWVNSIFAEWMGDGLQHIQAAYSLLSAKCHCEPEGRGNLSSGVHKFGEAVEGKAAEVRGQEVAAIASIVQGIKAAGWKVRADGDGNLRSAEFRDICILMPTRNILPSLERALDGAGIPYRVESESFVLGTQDVRELLNCLRAIDSPADRVALVAALRSTAFGCSDVELVRFLENGGKLDYTAPGSGEGPVREALQSLSKFNAERGLVPLDRLIERFIRERRMEELSFFRPRPRERLRRLCLIVEKARAFAQVGGSSLRAFADWMDTQATGRARMVEAPLPEKDEDAVRIMTIHAAKGLEFPIVLLAGIGSSGGGRGNPVLFGRRDNSVHVRIGSGNSIFTTPGYEEAKENESIAEEAEAVRLMYVAATRAKDHLILSLFRKGGKTPGKSSADLIEALAKETECSWDGLDHSPAGALPAGEKVNRVETLPDSEADREKWIKNRSDIILSASKKIAVSATQIAHVAKEEADDEQKYYRTGRGGTNLGRAVHSVLQGVDLATGEGLDAMSRAESNAEGIGDRWQEVSDLVQSALNSDIVRRAVASGKYYREVFVSVPVESGLVEGFVDLLFEENGGLVIADYKTDALEDEADAIKRQEQYSLQAGAYAFIVSSVTHKPVKEVVLVFLRSGRQISVTDIEQVANTARKKALVLLR
jgi:ATP-dependent helicase/nuclease subunit A